MTGAGWNHLRPCRIGTTTVEFGAVIDWLANAIGRVNLMVYFLLRADTGSMLPRPARSSGWRG